jgi:hypothetical protein
MSSELSGGLSKVSSPEDFPSGKTCLDERTGERICIFEARRRLGIEEEPVHQEYVAPVEEKKGSSKSQAQLAEEKALAELDAELEAEEAHEPFVEEEEDDDDEEGSGEDEEEEEGAETPKLPKRKGSEEGMAAKEGSQGPQVMDFQKAHPAKIKKWMKENGFQIPASGKRKDLIAAIEEQGPQADAADAL